MISNSITRLELTSLICAIFIVCTWHDQRQNSKFKTLDLFCINKAIQNMKHLFKYAFTSQW